VVDNLSLPTASCLVPRMVTAPGMTSLGEKTLGCDVESCGRFGLRVPLMCTCPMSRAKWPGPEWPRMHVVIIDYVCGI
jgi:hypothetical protein